MSIPSQFGVSPSGAATYSIPIQVPPGVAGLQPKLSLEYNSQSGNGILGMGWNLSGLSAITRCPKTMATDAVRGSVNYNTEDRFCMDGQRLMINVSTYGAAGSEYRTEIDTFSRITAVGAAAGNSANGPEYFKVQTKAGLTMEYGATSDSRIEAVKSTGSNATWSANTVRVWALNKVTDAVGNSMTVGYLKDAGQFYPLNLTYAGNQVQFNYQSRNDTSTAYHAGGVTRQNLLLKEITTWASASQTQTIIPRYHTASSLQPTRLARLSVCAGRALDLGGDTCLKDLVFSSDPITDVSFTAQTLAYPNAPNFGTSGTPRPHGSGFSSINWQPLSGDFNGDGRTDFIRIDARHYWMFLSNGDGTFNTVVANYPSNPDFGIGANYWIPLTGDFNGDGKTDLIRVDISGYWMFLSNGDGTFNAVNLPYPGAANFDLTSSAGYANWSPQTGDFDGDGRTDLLRIDATGYWMFLSNGDGTFRHYSLGYPGGTNFGSTSHPWLPMVADFNGDGKSDLLRINATGYWLFMSKGDGTFSELTANYPGSPNFGTTSTNWLPQIGDFNGDGKTDFMRVDATQYWMFLGNGDGTFNHVTASYPGGFNFGNSPGNWMPQAGDFNGDGKTDLMRIDATNYWMFLSNGDGTFSSSTLAYPNAPNFGVDARSWLPLGGDYNGDGKSDLLRIDATNYWLFTNQPGTDNLLRAAGTQENVLAGVSIDYRQLTRPLRDTNPPITWGSFPIFLTSPVVYIADVGVTYPQIDLKVPLQLVASTTSGNGIGGANTVSYQYGGLKAENGTAAVPGSGRGMLGFRWMKSIEQLTGIESYTEYNQAWPYIGAAIKNETRLAGVGNGGLLKRSSTTYQATTGSATNTTFVFPGSTVEESWDLNGVQLPTISSYYEYAPSAYAGSDGTQYGDPSRIVVNTSYQGADAGRKTTVNTYAPAATSRQEPSKWVLGRLTRASVTSESNPGPFTPFAPPPPPASLSAAVIAPLVAVLPTTAAVSVDCFEGYGTQVTFTANASVTGGSGGYQYAWSNSGPGIVNMSAPGNLFTSPTGSIAMLSFHSYSPYNNGGVANIRVNVSDADGRSVQSNILQVTATNNGCNVYDPAAI
ncbi:MAG: FG-GAP-like repeat-containing protein [Burkholderiaceae bacterium]